MEKKEFNCYYRQDCHLCIEMTAALTHWQQKLSFQVNYIDIDESADLIQRYGRQIPVLETVSGNLICCYFFDQDAFLQSI